MRIVLFTLGLVLASCTASEEKTTASDRQTQEPGGVVQLGDFQFNVATSREIADVTITSASYDASKHAVTIGIDHKACAAKVHDLLFSDVCAESYPAQCGGAIVQAKGEKICETSQHEDLEIPLKATQDEFVLFIAAKTGKAVSVLIDREGKVKKNTTPP